MLPGDDFFPEGIARTRRGALFVGSLATGQIVRFAPGATEPQSFVPAGGPIRGAAGLLVDRFTPVLWVCDVDRTLAAPSALVGLRISDGQELVRHTFPWTGSFCNDLVQVADGSLYATDSTGHRIGRVDAADRMRDTAVVEWVSDQRFVVPAGQLGLNGLAVMARGLYTVNFTTGQLFRIPLGPEGTAGKVVEVMLPRPLAGPDGLMRLAAGALLVVESGGGRIARIDLPGAPGVPAALTTLSENLDSPTTAVLTQNRAWVVEGQLDHLRGADPAPPSLPFRVAQVTLP